MNDLDYLKKRAAECFRGLNSVLNTLNSKYAKPDFRWAMDEDAGVVRQYKLPSFEWESFEEPNDPIWSEEDQQLVLGER